MHTSDWHLGRSFHATTADPARQERLRAARFTAVERLGEAARAAEAEAVLVAGDLFHGHAVDDATVLRALDVIGGIGLPVLAIPGNHDHGGPGGVWERRVFTSERAARAPNLDLIRGGATLRELAGMAVLALPVDAGDRAPQLRDLSGLETAAGRPRVGLVHAPVLGFTAEGGGRTLETGGAAGLALDYLALGDFHRPQEVPAGRLPARAAWYAGTHEPDAYPSHDQTGERRGGALLVEIDAAGEAPQVQPLAIPGGFTWTRQRSVLRGDADLETLSASLRAMAAGRAQSVLLELDISGSELTYAQRRQLAVLVEELTPAFEVLAIEGEPACLPAAGELAALTGRPGLIGAVAARLAAAAVGEDEAALIARTALERLAVLAGAEVP